MRKKRTHYDKTFKDNAVNLSLERKNVSEFAHELGISPTLMYRRRKEYQERWGTSFPGNGIRSREGEAGRIVELERRLKEAETERDILKKSFKHHLHERSLIYRFIKNHSKKWTIEMMCRVLNVSRSSYYRRLKDPEGKRKRKSMKLSREIKDAYFNVKGRNGSPRLVGDLRALGIAVSGTTMPRHMQRMDSFILHA